MRILKLDSNGRRAREREKEKYGEIRNVYVKSGGHGVNCLFMNVCNQPTADYCFNINNIENTFDRLLEQTSNIQCNLHGCACCAFKM